MITAVTLCLGLTFERPEANVMDRPPRNPKAPPLSYYQIWRIVFVSFILMLAALLLFNLELRRGQSIEVARTIVACTIVVGQMAYLLNCRFLRQLVADQTDFLRKPVHIHFHGHTGRSPADIHLRTLVP